ncbi:MAG: thioredoxin family protein [Cyanobacteriota bacterium]|nr:thioredoxin family protein [Cyanobacteriota bacterium]
MRDDSALTKAIEGSKTLLVDVWAEWCGPCRLMAPMMTWAAHTYADRLVVAKLNADASPAAVERLGVQGLPTLIIYQDGMEVARHEGAIPKAQLQAFLEPHL